MSVDDVDIAQEKQSAQVDASLRRLSRQESLRVPADDCIDCGTEIDEERREASPKANRCLECQEFSETYKRLHGSK